MEGCTDLSPAAERTEMAFWRTLGSGWLRRPRITGWAAVALDFEEAERVENFFRVGGKDFAGQEIRRGAVQRQRRGLVCIKPVLTNGFLQSSNVLLPATETTTNHAPTRSRAIQLILRAATCR